VNAETNNAEIARLAQQLVTRASAAGIMVTCAESCTGGLVAAALTDIAGASAVLDRGFVTYSNAAKTDLLGVAPATLVAHGAVSAETATEMADGALGNANGTSLAVSITGIAGPGGGSADKPVGLVFFGRAIAGGSTQSWRHHFTGDRVSIRQQATMRALKLIIEGIPGQDHA